MIKCIRVFVHGDPLLHFPLILLSKSRDDGREPVHPVLGKEGKYSSHDQDTEYRSDASNQKTRPVRRGSSTVTSFARFEPCTNGVMDSAFFSKRSHLLTRGANAC